MAQYVFLGTGTSQGIPVIGCSCDVCLSEDSNDKRLRSSLLVIDEHRKILIDCGPDLRQQLLRAKVDNLSGILITHEHNDHIIGLDDVKPLNFKHSKDMEVYCLKRVGDDLIKRFDYIFSSCNYPGIPKVNLNIINKDSLLDIEGVAVKAIAIQHGKLPILGYVFKDFAYLTDVKSIPDDEMAKLTNIKHIVMSALHHKKHHSHQNLEEAIHLANNFPDAQIYLTHFSHYMGKHEVQSKLLPSNIMMAYDGLIIET